MKKVKGVKRLAKQFLNGVDISEVPQAISQMGAVAGLMEKDRNFRNMMASPVFSAEENSKVISYLGQKLGMTERTSKYMGYLFETGAMSALPVIVEAITDGYLEMKKRIKAVVTASAKISADYEQKIKDSLKHLTGRDVDVEFLVDPSLLGGVNIKIGSTMYDSSIKGQLGLLRDKLIKG